MRTRFQRQVERRPGGIIARGADGRRLGMLDARVFMPSFPDNAAVPNNDASDGRVRARQPCRFSCEVERPFHVALIVVVKHVLRDYRGVTFEMRLERAPVPLLFSVLRWNP